ALLGTSVPMPVGDAFLAAARDDSPAALDMEAVWGHARDVLLATSAVPGASLLGGSRRLNGRSRRGVLAADLGACAAYRPADESLRSLGVPTLVVAGTRDQMTPWKAGKSVADRIPGSRFVSLDAGHSMMAEAPRATLVALREFLPGDGQAGKG
ncbi:MAG TPA: alpha/beta hydrolase, partial [Usitatibacter sp.]|nr:alpha/beta hydrolase [Usitatibacter sp.]